MFFVEISESDENHEDGRQDSEDQDADHCWCQKRNVESFIQ